MVEHLCRVSGCFSQVLMLLALRRVCVCVHRWRNLRRRRGNERDWEGKAVVRREGAATTCLVIQREPLEDWCGRTAISV
jgi:hypothetical protein